MSREILVVNDKDSLRRVYSKSLEITGYKISIAKDGKEAIDTLNGEKDFSGLVLDIHMPRKDGFEVLRYIINRGIEIPVVVTTTVDVSKTLESIEYPVHLEDDKNKIVEFMKQELD